MRSIPLRVSFSAIALAIVVGVFGRPALVHADDALPTAKELTAAIESARGKAPENEHVVVAYVRNGVTGVVTTYRMAPDYRVTETYGPFTSQSGSIGGRRWHADYNGQIVYEQADPGNAAKERYETTVTRVAYPADAFVLSRLNARGYGTREFVDPTTYHVFRLENISGTRTIVTTYDRFVTTGGYTRATHWKREDGAPENTAEFTATTDEVGDVVASQVAMPARRELVQFPAGVTKVSLPVTMRRGKFIVRVTIAGRGLDFILDTGAAGIVIDDDVARSLGLSIVTSERNSANAGAFTEGQAVVPTMNVGSLSMHDVIVRTAPHSGDEGQDFKAVGLLGFDFIAGTELALDYENGKLTASAPGTDFIPTDDPALILPVRLSNETPETDVRVNDALGERFTIDTGAADAGLLVFDYFARRYPEAVADVAPATNLRMRGVGGEIAFQPFRAKTVEIGSVTFNDFDAARVKGPAYGNEDGLIGPTFLKLFTAYLDYDRSRIVLIFNAVGKQSMHTES